MLIMATIAGPHAVRVCPGQETALSRVNAFADVWSEPFAGVTSSYVSRRPRPDAQPILDPQRVSAPPRWGP